MAQSNPLPGPLDHSTGRALLYPRVSTVGQAEKGYSLAEQEARQREYCRQKGYAIVGVYPEAYSGASEQRPQLTHVLSRLLDGDADRVIAADLDRFTRMPVGESFMLRSLIRQAGGELEFVEGNDAYHDPEMGDLNFALKSWLSNMERLNIMKRTTRGRKQKITSGKVLGAGRAPYGLRYTTERLDGADTARVRRVGYREFPAEAVIVRRIFAEYAGGASLYEIAAGLTRDGIPTPSGRLSKWPRNTVQRMVRNPVYTGTVHANRWLSTVSKAPRGTGTQGRTYTARPLDEQTLLEGRAPEIIDAATWATVQARLDENRVSRRRVAANPDAHLLRGGHARCAVCGTIMSNCAKVGRSGKPGYRCAKLGEWRCANGSTIMAATIDADIWARVARALADPDRVAAQAAAKLASGDPMDALRLAAVEERQRSLTEQAANLVANLRLVTGHAAALVAKDLEQVTADLATLQDEQARLVGAAADRQAAVAQLNDLAAALRTVGANLGAATLERKRWALDLLQVDVRVAPKGTTPRWTATAIIDLDLADDAGGVLSPMSYRCGQQHTLRHLPLDLVAD